MNSTTEQTIHPFARNVERPKFCRNCVQIQALGESEYCARCIDTIARHHRPQPARRVWMFAMLVVAAILSIFAVIYKK